MSDEIVNLYEGNNILIWKHRNIIFVKVVNTTFELDDEEFDELVKGIQIANSTLKSNLGV